jgi:hypothetical protein
MMTNRKTLKRQYLETKTRAGVYAIRNQAMEIRGAKLDEHESLRGPAGAKTASALSGNVPDCIGFVLHSSPFLWLSHVALSVRWQTVMQFPPTGL